MSYRVNILRRAQKELAALPLDAYERLKRELKKLAAEPRPPGTHKLSAREGWRLRVGRYRVIYEIDDSAKVITILHVGHRKDIYRPQPQPVHFKP